MEAASLSRRVRLEELRGRRTAGQARQNGQGIDENVDLPGEIHFDEQDQAMQLLESPEEEEALRRRVRAWSTAKLVRSFRVLDRKQRRVDYAKLKDTIERDIAGMQELIIAEHEQKRKEDLDLHNIQPKRINWDLKRDMQKRLAKLERRDREARLILIRQRIASATTASGDGASNGTKTDESRAQADAAAAAVAASGALASELLTYPASESEEEEEEAEER